MEVAQVVAAAVGVHTGPGPAHAAAVRHTVLGAACRIVLAVAAAALGTVDSQYPGLPHTAVTAGTLLCAALPWGWLLLLGPSSSRARHDLLLRIIPC